MSLKCFECKGPLRDRKCRHCGAEMKISQTTGNVIWVRRGRVVSAFQDEKEAWIEMAKKWGIPKKDWPDKFK